MLSRRVLNRTLVYQINREEAPPGNDQKGLLEGKPTVQLNRTLGFPDFYKKITKSENDLFCRKRAEYCFESTVSEERTHCPENLFGLFLTFNLARLK